MPRASLYRRAGRADRWRVSWREPGARFTRQFITKAEAEEFAATLPSRREGKPYRRYDCDQDRITLNIVVNEVGCWDWQLYCHPTEQYGYMTFAGRRQLAHRLSYELLVGPIPAGLQIDHLCRNRKCVNPDHLEPVTAWENVQRAPYHLGPINASKTHCKWGHEFSPENTRYVTKYGYRSCATCARDAKRKAAERRRNASQSVAA